jgi:hypothetical protein
VAAACAQIAALKPDLVVTEKGLSDLAAHFLTKVGLSCCCAVGLWVFPWWLRIPFGQQGPQRLRCSLPHKECGCRRVTEMLLPLCAV